MANFDGVLAPAAGWNDVPQATNKMALLGGPGAPLNAQAEALAARSGLLAHKAGSGAFTPYGGQLAILGEDLFDPLVQEMQITFIGDSIPWGVGSSGASPTGTHDKTLSDPRNNGASPSFVNEFGRWVASILGANAVTTFSNHYASPSGESIRTITAVKNEFPIGAAYTVVGSGTFTDITDQNIAGPALRGRRTLSVADGGKVSLSFQFTGSEFTLIYSQMTNGANYDLTVDGVLIGTYPSGGGAALFNQRRLHSFPYIINKTITVSIQQPSKPGPILQLRVEGFAINKTVRIKNQAVSGVHTAQYVEYNMPTATTGGKSLLPTEIPSYAATQTGTGSHSLTIDTDEPSAIRGQAYIYGFLNTGEWTITVNPPANTDRMTIYFSSNDNTAGVQVFNGATLLSTFYTSSTEPDMPFGYKNNRVISYPKGTATLTIKTLWKDYGYGVLYFKLQALQFDDSAVPSYPVDNGFHDGLALDYKDSFAFIQLGINDRGSAKVSSPAATRAALASLVSLMPVGCKPIFMAPNNSIDSGGIYFNNAEVMQAIRQEAKRLGIDFINNRALFEGYSLSSYTTDNLHPNDFGHKLICENIITSIMRG